MADRYAPSHTEEPVRAEKRGKTPAWRLIIQDILLTGLVLCIFALFHHVIPRMGIAKAEPPKPTSAALAPSEVRPRLRHRRTHRSRRRRSWITARSGRKNSRITLPMR